MNPIVMQYIIVPSQKRIKILTGILKKLSISIDLNYEYSLKF